MSAIPPINDSPEALMKAYGGTATVRRAETLPKVSHRFAFEMANEITFDAANDYLVKGLLPAQGVGVVYGRPGAGKSFLMLDLAMHVAMGRSWMDRRIAQGGVVYIAAEAGQGMRKRAHAFMQERGCEAFLPFALVTTAPNLGSLKGDADTLIQDVRAQLPKLQAPLRMINIDTVSSTMGEGEENSTGMAAFISNALKLANAFQCMVFVAHHPGKDSDRGMRGWSGLEGNVDAVWKVESDEDAGIKTVFLEKLKDGEKGLSWSFRLPQVRLGYDADGDPVTSCIVEPETKPKHVQKVSTRKQPTGQDALVLRAVREAASSCPGFPPASIYIPKSVTAVSRKTVQEYAERLGFGDPNKPDSARAMFSTALRKLIGNNWLGSWNDGPEGKGTQWIWTVE